MATLKEHPYSFSIMFESGVFDFHDIMKHSMILLINGFAGLSVQIFMTIRLPRQ